MYTNGVSFVWLNWFLSIFIFIWLCVHIFSFKNQHNFLKNNLLGNKWNIVFLHDFLDFISSGITFKQNSFLQKSYFYFILYKQNKKLVSCKFSTSGFCWICTFWDVLNTIWLFLENVCLCVCVTKILWQV